ncbi:pyridoxal-phosphate dependent enzyme [Proteiniclasticum sp.]|uniref:1-aminocyclopropane-1-carboxylate deaminase/D-cysteine desulfhydrase n=1 Tax=Proteiniclasticum sp. TaxID=2053595 RepID=UPI002897609E|nr:pyridoxal-phosphate dependent enzyme [Proteiniclasticum sp.]
MFKNANSTPIFQLKYSSNSNQFYIKRDDLLPFSFGGNKVRIAEEYFNDMCQKDCDCIISYGSSKSNLNRVIANMSKSMGIPCYVVSPNDNESETQETFNSMLVKNIGANIVLCNKNEVADTIESLINQCNREGLRPYYINGNKYGNGNKEVPVRAYIKAYEEILEYERNAGLEFDYIFHASGTGMTQAGLLCGSILNHDEKEIIGISIARSSETGAIPIKDSIDSYFKSLNINKTDAPISFTDKYVCGGYGKYNNQIISTVQRVYNTEGIALDTTYTGKAFWGMTEYVKEKQISNSKILFIHTGGTPLFFDDLNSRKLKENA